MADTDAKDLYDELRDRGLRKRVARSASQAVADLDGNRPPSADLRGTTEDLRAALSQLEEKVSESDRRAAARKAARTRRAKAEKRSAVARKAARSRTSS